MRTGERDLFRRTVSVIVLALLLTSMLVLAFNIQPVKAAPATIIVPDDYPKIQEAINAAIEGDTVYVRAGTYVENVTVNKTISFIGQDKYTTIIDGNGVLEVALVAADNVFVRGFTFMNSSGPVGEGGGGLVVERVGGIQISNIVARDNHADFGVHFVPNSHDIDITQSIIANNTRGGLLLHRCWNVNAYNNTITNNDQAGIETLRGSYGNNIYNNTITGNRVGLNLHYYSNDTNVSDNTFINNLQGIQILYSTNMILRGNEMTGNSASLMVQGTRLEEFLHDIDTSNTVDGKPVYYWVNKTDLEVPADAGFVGVVNSMHITVQNLTMTSNGEGVFLAYTTDSIVRNVTAQGNTIGIGLFSSDNNIVYGNTATANGLSGIYLASSSNNTVNGNNFATNSWGIYLYSSSNNNIISGNIATANVYSGICLNSSSNNNYVSANTITNNGYNGIWLLNSSNYNSISGNTITNSHVYGIQLSSSSNNVICHNSFVNNNQQVYSFDSTNVWDDGYPSGGNYWSDYTGVDVKSGPSQDQPGSDGIGDTPYVIDGNDTDHYPLMGAWGSTPPIHVPEDYGSIQAAVDAAIPWTTILIGPGVYNESIVVNKPLTIIGRLGSEPVFKGGGSGIAITLLSGASGTVIAGIVITDWDQGILINNASDCKIYNNIMSLMGIKGIVLEGVNAVNNQVYNNIFQQDPVAVNIASSSRNNNVSRNIISLSTIAIKIETSANTIYANIMSQNQVGINITNSNSNVIYHNNFVNNTVQVSISDSTGNTWDDGYPSGGNYWSDCIGVDLKSGPNQDQAGSDGIVDAAYTVAVGGIDSYPLARPFNAHDVGIMDYAVSKTVVGRGYTLSLEVKILNYGVYDEHFLVTAYANTSTAGAQELTLIKSNSIILTLTWNTSSFAYGNYTVNAQAESVLNETNTADNILCCGTVYVGIPGDVNGDGGVDIYDAIVISNSFMSTSGSRKWNANANINGDNIVDIYDAIILANHYNQHYP